MEDLLRTLHTDEMRSLLSSEDHKKLEMLTQHGDMQSHTIKDSELIQSSNRRQLPQYVAQEAQVSGNSSG